MIAPRRGPIALLYHSFDTEPRADDPHRMVVTADAFRAQLRALLDGGWKPLDLDGFLAAARRPRLTRSFLVTIDDAFCSMRDVALPILTELGIPAVLFVPADRIGASSSWMPDWPHEPTLDADGIRAVVAAGVELGAHGLDHSDLTARTPEELVAHTGGAAKKLAAYTDAPIRAFAWPRGVYDDAARRAVEDAGFEIAFSVTEPGGRFAVPRVTVTADDSVGKFRLKLLPGYWGVWHLAARMPALRRWARQVVDRAKR